MDKKTLAVIPARGGSKRIPRKNIKEFCGKPIIAYSIETALGSGLFDHVLVSSDDDEIRRLSVDLGAEASFSRPDELADDFTPTVPVIRHAISAFEEELGEVDKVCCIYPTAPFVTKGVLRQGLDLLMEEPETEFVFTAAAFSYSIFRSLKMEDDGSVSMFWPENELVRSQDLPAAFHDAGQFYWGRRQSYFDYEWFVGKRSRVIVLPGERVQDIDTEEDWRRAELLFEQLSGE